MSRANAVAKTTFLGRMHWLSAVCWAMLWCLAPLTVLTLSGCLLGGDRESEFGGSVGDGPVVDATITVTDANGDVVQTSTSDTTASYSVKVRKGTDFPLVIEASGGTDVVTGEPPTFAMLSAATGASESTANISPLSTLIVRAAQCMPEGLNDTTLSQATASVMAHLAFGLDPTLVPDPLTTPIDAHNVASMVKANEAMAEMIRRTRAVLLGTDVEASEDELSTHLGCDLADGILDGSGPGVIPRLTAATHVVSAQVLLEVLQNQIAVNGVDATAALDAAILIAVPGAPASATTANVTLTHGVLEQTRVALQAALAVAPTEPLALLAAAVGDVAAGSLAADVILAVPAGASGTLQPALESIATAPDATVTLVNQRVVDYLAAASGVVAPFSGVTTETLLDTPNRHGTVIVAPNAPMRAELVGQHPRLMFTAADIGALRSRLTDPRVQRYYTPAWILNTPPPPYRPGARNGGEYKYLGSLALGHLLAPDPRKLSAILEWLEMAVTYGDVGVDLDAEYFLRGLALTYDWLYHEIPPNLRARVRDTIAEKTRRLYLASLDGRQGGGLSFQQNHYWAANFALALGAAAIYGEVAEAEQWLLWGWDRFERIALSFSPDGSFHEGSSYWDQSMPILYAYVDLYEHLTGRPIPSGNEGLAGQARFRFHHLLPGLEETVPLEDTHKGHGQPPAYLLLWEAKRFRDPTLMRLAELLMQRRTHYQALLWLDPELPVEDPLPNEPLARHFADVGTVLARSSWNADATYVALVSRPLGGHKWAALAARYKLGGMSHNHPAQNHFVLFGRGEMLVGDPGYTYEKRTRNHNTVLVDGQGQYGDGLMWPGRSPGRSRITAFVTDGDITIAGGDATSAYPPELGLTGFRRHLVLVGKDLVVVHDRLTASTPRTFSWLLHHYGTLVPGPGSWTLQRGGAQLTVAPVAPADAVARTTRYRPVYVLSSRDITPSEPDIDLLELQSGPTQEATFLVPLLVGAAGSPAPTVEDASGPHYDAIRVDDTLVVFNRTRNEFTVRLPWGASHTSTAHVLVARLHQGERQIVEAR